MADPIEITWATEAKAIGEEAIDRFHRHLQNEDEVRVLYLFSNQKRKTRGKVVLATTRRLSPTEVFLLSGGPALSFTLGGHDVEEFSDIIARHGLWKPDLEQFGTEAAKQLALI